MRDSFIGRAQELKLLADAYHSGHSTLIPIYGRRRIGKSELILRFLQDKPGIYFLGKQAPAALQIREFLAAAAAALQEPLLASYAAEGWQQALEAVAGRWEGPGKLVLAFDEFQWTAEASPELPSVLQALWDRQWRPARNVELILCGSAMGFMEREVLGKKSPLFGRRTAQVRLQPFGYQEAAAFHPGYGAADRARAYFVCGGVPMYLLAFQDERSIEQNIAQALLNEHAPLFREPDFLLREELRELEKYNALMFALAGGHTTSLELAKHTGISERSLHYYLQQLIELGYVGKRQPLTADPPNARQVRYGLDDPLLRFWFRYVFPHTSFIAQMGATRALETLIRPTLDGYFGTCFERLCREALPALYAQEGVMASFEVGEYWHKDVQIDVVGVRQDGWIDLGECKWGTVGSAKAVVEQLSAKLARYPNPRGDTLGLRIFTRNALPAAKAKHPRARWHSLDELYALPMPT